MKPEDETNEVYRFFTEVGIINQLISTKLEAFLPGRMTATQFGILGHLVRRLDVLEKRRLAAWERSVDDCGRRLAGASDRLRLLSPRNVLGRGYSITKHVATGRIVRSARDAAAGDLLETSLREGKVVSRVEPARD